MKRVTSISMTVLMVVVMAFTVMAQEKTQSHTKMMLPNPIDHHTSSQRIVCRGDSL